MTTESEVVSDDWREIPLRLIDWSRCTGLTARTANILAIQCREPNEWQKTHHRDEAEKRWCNMTLGELADRGERWWRRHGMNVGKGCCDAIKLTIDHAAAGYEVRWDRPSHDAYVPRKVPPPPPGKERRAS